MFFWTEWKIKIFYETYVSLKYVKLLKEIIEKYLKLKILLMIISAV